MKAVGTRLLALCFIIMTLAVQPAQAGSVGADKVMRDWYRLVLELVRHTPTYSPPVASRAFAYLGVTAYEGLASGDRTLTSLSGQLNGLTPVPQRQAGLAYDEAVVMQAALSSAARQLFTHTGPTGQRAMKRMTEKLAKEVSDGLAPDLVTRSQAYGESVTAHILSWSISDARRQGREHGLPAGVHAQQGTIELGTHEPDQPAAEAAPAEMGRRTGPSRWKRAMAAPCQHLPAYSEETGSDFYQEAHRSLRDRQEP